MTKAEQKKLEKEARDEFIKKAFGCVLEAIFEASAGIRNAPEVRAVMKNGSRYIRFHRYGNDFNVQIYRSGDVDIEFKEFCHDDRLYRLFEYTEDKALQDTFLEQFRKDMLMVVTEFLIHADWHIVLDYLPLEHTKGWREAFIDSLEPAVNPEEPLRWNPGWVSKYTDNDSVQ